MSVRFLVGAAVLVAAAVILAYAWSPRRHDGGVRAGPPPPVPCTVTVSDPAGGLATVRLELDAGMLGGRREIVLAFADAPAGPAGLRSFVAEVDGVAVTPASEPYRGALLQRIPLAAGARRLVVTYTVNPTFYPPGSDVTQPADARGRIGADLAVVRSTSLLPLFDVPGSRLAVEFDLPPGWVTVAPWPPDGMRLLAPADGSAPVEYLAFGPFETRDFTVGDATVRVARLGAFEQSAFPVEAVLAREIELVGAPLKRAGLFVATLVPDDFMHGGAAGERTIVQSSAPQVLAHEVFHWWNDGTLTAGDAGWFREGLTEYYGIKVAREANAWTADAETACLADLNGEMRMIEQGGPRSLVDASLDPRLGRLVYSKGALFWLLVDRKARSNGRFLEEAVRRVVTSDRRGLSTAEIRTLFSSVYDGLFDQEFDRYVTGAEPLPDLETGPATGRSGCARDLPPLPR
jgi:hypothetical protein